MSTTADASTLQRFVDQRTVILTSYRRDGSPIDTPMHVALAGDHAVVRTYARALKWKRLRRRPEAELWLASNGMAPAVVALFRRRATHRIGVPLRVHVCTLEGEADRRAAHALACKYPLLQGLVIPLMHRLWRTRTINLELRPAA
jgi:PPOX class probable F420-dependent enzyme